MIESRPIEHDPCPDLETLASFADGSLNPEKRASLVEHVSSCDMCLELVGDALASEADLHDSAMPTRQANDSGAGLTRGWLAAAAVLLALGAGSVFWLLSDRQPGGLAIVAKLPEDQLLRDRLGDGWNDSIWSVMRGSEVVATTPEAAVRIGVRRVDLLTALRARDTEESAGMAGALSRVLRADDATALSAFDYDEMLVRLANSEEFSTWQEEETLVRSLEVAPKNYFEAGSWLEATRLAASVLGEDFPASRTWRLQARRWQRRASGELLEALQQVEASAGQNAERLQTSAKTAIRLLAEGEAVLDE